MYMRIVCAGMHRSGSTWLFNVLRMMFLEKNVPIYSCFENKYDPKNNALFHIVKVHKFKESIQKDADFIFTTCRDLRDIAASAIRRNLVEHTPDSVERYLREIIEREYKPWSSVSDYEVRYEVMFRDKEKEISKIAKRVGIYVDSKKVKKAVDLLIAPSNPNEFDEITQLHYNHITNGIPNSYKNTLSVEVIDRINFKFESWLKEKRYTK